MFGSRVAEPPKDVEVEGRKAKEYHFQGAPPIVVVRVGDRAIAAGTRGAAAAALRAEGAQALTGDPQFKPLLDSLKPESSKAVLVHVGRVASAMSARLPHQADEAQQMAALAGDLRFMIVTNEKPNEFSVSAVISGLPNVPAIVQTAVRMNQRGPRRSVSVRTRQSPPGIESRPTPARLIEEATRAPRVEISSQPTHKP
jgi:hypothetical protein